MKALLEFAAALSDSVRLRLLVLAQDHKISASELAEVLKQSPANIAKHTQQLIDAGLLKTDKAGQIIRSKRKAEEFVESVFDHFALSAKKDSTLEADAKALKEHRDTQRAAEKALRKAAKEAAKAKKKPKPKTKAKATV